MAEQVKQPPDRIWIQVFGEGAGRFSASDIHPHEVHDNGKPVYEYTRVSPASFGVEDVIRRICGVMQVADEDIQDVSIVLRHIFRDSLSLSASGITPELEAELAEIEARANAGNHEPVERGCTTCGADLRNCPECKTPYVDGSGYCVTCDTFTGPSDLGLHHARTDRSRLIDIIHNLTGKGESK